MNSKKNLVLAVSMIALTLSAFPVGAAASTTTTPAPTDSQMRASGDSKVKYMEVLQVAANLLTALLP